MQNELCNNAQQIILLIQEKALGFKCGKGKTQLLFYIKFSGQSENHLLAVVRNILPKMNLSI